MTNRDFALLAGALIIAIGLTGGIYAITQIGQQSTRTAAATCSASQCELIANDAWGVLDPALRDNFVDQCITAPSPLEGCDQTYSDCQVVAGQIGFDPQLCDVALSECRLLVGSTCSTGGGTCNEGQFCTGDVDCGGTGSCVGVTFQYQCQNGDACTPGTTEGWQQEWNAPTDTVDIWNPQDGTDIVYGLTSRGEVFQAFADSAAVIELATTPAGFTASSLWVAPNGTEIYVGGIGIPTDPNIGAIYRYSNGTWTLTELGPHRIVDIWFGTGNLGYAVGAPGIVYEHDVEWTEVVLPVSARMNSIWVSESSTPYLVGESGAIVRKDLSLNSWVAMTSPTTNHLNAISGSHSGDIWAVGHAGTILHFDGNSWSNQIAPTSIPLIDVWAMPGSTVSLAYAVAGDSQVYRYDAPTAMWQPEHVTNEWLHKVWGFSDIDVYVLGQSSGQAYKKGSASNSCSDNTACQEVVSGSCSCPATTCSIGQTCEVANDCGGPGGVCAISTGGDYQCNDGSLCDPTSGGTGAFAWESLGPIGLDSIYDVAGFDRNHILFAGEHATGIGTGLMSYIDGTWYGEVTNLNQPKLRGLWIPEFNSTASVDAYAVGEDNTAAGNVAVVLRNNGASWERLYTSTGNDGTYFEDVWANGNYNEPINYGLFVVGNTGVDNDGDTFIDGLIYHYDGQNFVEMALPAGTPALHAIHGGQRAAGASDVWVVGENGTVLFFDGSAWTKMSAPTNNRLNGVWSGPQGTFVVGDNGANYLWNGGSWFDFSAGTVPNNLYDVWGVPGSASSDPEVIIAGQGVTIHYEGGSMRPEFHSGANNLYGVWAFASDDWYVGGQNGVVMKYSRGTTGSSCQDGSVCEYRQNPGSCEICGGSGDICGDAICGPTEGPDVCPQDCGGSTGSFNAVYFDGDPAFDGGSVWGNISGIASLPPGSSGYIIIYVTGGFAKQQAVDPDGTFDAYLGTYDLAFIDPTRPQDIDIRLFDESGNLLSSVDYIDVTIQPSLTCGNNECNLEDHNCPEECGTLTMQFDQDPQGTNGQRNFWAAGLEPNTEYGLWFTDSNGQLLSIMSDVLVSDPNGQLSYSDYIAESEVVPGSAADGIGWYELYYRAETRRGAYYEYGIFRGNAGSVCTYNDQVDACAYYQLAGNPDAYNECINSTIDTACDTAYNVCTGVVVGCLSAADCEPDAPYCDESSGQCVVSPPGGIGGPGQACYPDGACNTGLVCENSVCASGQQDGCIDVDQDGHAFAGSDPTACTLPIDDCDDDTALRHPGLTEICFDGIDNDCNDIVDDCSGGGGSCPTGTLDCNNDGQCKDVLSDPNNCGGCGIACEQRPNTSSQCTSGGCSYSCETGFLDCDPNITGCETFDADGSGVCPTGTSSCVNDAYEPNDFLTSAFFIPGTPNIVSANVCPADNPDYYATEVGVGCEVTFVLNDRGAADNSMTLTTYTQDGGYIAAGSTSPNTRSVSVSGQGADVIVHALVSSQAETDYTLEAQISCPTASAASNQSWWSRMWNKVTSLFNWGAEKTTQPPQTMVAQEYTCEDAQALCGARLTQCTGGGGACGDLVCDPYSESNESCPADCSQMILDQTSGSAGDYVYINVYGLTPGESVHWAFVDADGNEHFYPGDPHVDPQGTVSNSIEILEGVAIGEGRFELRKDDGTTLAYANFSVTGNYGYCETSGNACLSNQDCPIGGGTGGGTGEGCFTEALGFCEGSGIECVSDFECESPTNPASRCVGAIRYCEADPASTCETDADCGGTQTYERCIISGGDTEPPSISFDPLPQFTNGTEITISGTISDNDQLAYFTINGQDVALDDTGYYSVTITLEEGQNLITMEAADVSGNLTTSEASVLVDTQAPTTTYVGIDDDNDGSFSSIVISATDNPKPPADTSSGTQELWVSVNNGPFHLFDGNTATIDLSGYIEATVAFYAVDAAGNQEEVQSYTFGVDVCPEHNGRAEYQGCPVGDETNVVLHIVNIGGGPSTKLPLENVETRIYDRNNPDFQAVAGSKNPSGDLYGVIFETDAGNVGTCYTDEYGVCIAGEAQIGDYLVIVKYIDIDTGQTVYVGRPKGHSDFTDTDDDGVLDLAVKDFQIIKVFKKGTFQGYRGGSKIVITGSILEVIVPESAVWEGTSSIYPFIFTSDSDWDVDVCAEVASGYSIVGVYDDTGNLIPSADCFQTFVSGETKVAAFEVLEMNSPEPSFTGTLNFTHKGKKTQKKVNVKDIRKNTLKNKVAEAKTKKHTNNKNKNDVSAQAVVQKKDVFKVLADFFTGIWEFVF